MLIQVVTIKNYAFLLINGLYNYVSNSLLTHIT